MWPCVVYFFNLSPLCAICVQQMVKVHTDMVKSVRGKMLACFRMLVSSHISCSTGSRTPSSWQLMAGTHLEMENRVQLIFMVEFEITELVYTF